jgi:phosphoserine aminotransferase
MKRIYNFSAGPAMLNPYVIEATSKATIEYNDSGMSLMEMSHRSQPVVDMVAETDLLVRELLKIPENYHVLFLQGGASLQFSMIPMNLLNDDQTADYTDTGAWAQKAINEAQVFGNVNVASSSKDSVYNHIPKVLNQSSDAVYLHLTSNNTIYGTQWSSFPELMNPDSFLVADMSSDIFSREINIVDFGLIYAGAQKNIGPAGVTLVIVRDDILGNINRKIPIMLQYQTHIAKHSMFNTPPVMAIYAVNRSLYWLKNNGGVNEIEHKNHLKAQKLYDEIERNTLFKSPVNHEDRSIMNIPFIYSKKLNEDDFLSFCDKRGLTTLKGHRSVGGFRASIYNAMPESGVDALIKAMQDFEKEH